MATKQCLSLGAVGVCFAHVCRADGFHGRFLGPTFRVCTIPTFRHDIVVAGLQAYHLSVNGGHQLFGLNDTYHFILNLFMASSWGLEEV